MKNQYRGKVEEKYKRKEDMQTRLSPLVFAPQMKMQLFSLEAWCRL